MVANLPLISTGMDFSSLTMVLNLYVCPEAFKYQAHLIIAGNQFELLNVLSELDS